MFATILLTRMLRRLQEARSLDRFWTVMEMEMLLLVLCICMLRDITVCCVCYIPDLSLCTIQLQHTCYVFDP